VSGGIGTLAVVAVAAMGIPELRRYGRLDGRPAEPLETESDLESTPTVDVL